MRKHSRLLPALAIGFLAVASVSSSWAVDGVILIDQNKAMAGGVTPGDAPGFPVTISLPGSYRLAGNLTVPDANTSAIVIAADHVTLDLNGFAILGSTDCSGRLNPCANAGSGIGISTLNANPSTGGPPKFNITIRNGTIQGMGSTGILLMGDSHLVEYVHARSNGDAGIRILQSDDLAGSIVQHCTVQRNGGHGGIGLGRGRASHNVADVNFDNGIGVDTGTASYNVVTRTVNFGLILGGDASYIGNVVVGNGIDVTGGVNLGQNLCSGFVVCPGAKF